MDSKQMKTTNEIASFLINEGKDASFTDESLAAQWGFVKGSKAYLNPAHPHHAAALSYANAVNEQLGETSQAAQDAYFEQQATEQQAANAAAIERENAWKARGDAGHKQWPEVQRERYSK